MISKLNLYLKSGVKEYWVVNLYEKTILQYSFSEERDLNTFSTLTTTDTIESQVFPELTLSLQDLFAQL